MPRGLIACRVLGTEVPVLVGRFGSHKACSAKLAVCAHILEFLASTMSVASSSVDDGVTEEINIGTDSSYRQLDLCIHTVDPMRVEIVSDDN